jgi:flagellin
MQVTTKLNAEGTAAETQIDLTAKNGTESGGTGISKNEKGLTLNISNQQAASVVAEKVRDVINDVSSQRASLGALENRLDYTMNNLNTASENITDANSRIRDTDMAKTMMQYTQGNTLTQAAQAMLAQANQAPSSVLQLLQ